MPNIPTAYSQAPFPLVPMSPGAAASPFEARERTAQVAGRAAERAGETAQYGAQVYDFLQRAQENVEALKIKNNLAADFDEEAQKYLLRGDYKNFSQDATQFIENTRKKYDDIIGKNPRLQKAFSNYFDIQSRRFNHVVRLKEAHEIQKEGQTQFLMDLDRAATEMAGEPDSERKEFIRNEINMQTEFLIGSHVLERLWAYEKLKHLDEKAEETEIVNGVKSLDVSTIDATLDKLSQRGSFPNVDPVKKANFQAFGEQRVERLSKQYQAEVDKINIDKGFKNLKSKYTVGDETDYTAMRKELRSPSFQKDYTLPQIEAIEKGINAEESGANKDKKVAHDKEEKQLSDLFVNHQYNKALDLLKSSKLLTGDEVRTWSNAIEKAGKKLDEDISPYEDSQNYIRINQMIDLGADPNVIRTQIALSPMKAATRQKLLDRVDKDIETHVREGMKRGNDYLHKQIAPSKSMFEAAKPEQEAQSAKAQQALHDYVDTQSKLAAGGKRKPLTEKEIFDKAVEMADYYKMGLTEQMESFQKQMEEEARKARTKKTPKEQSPTKEQYEIGIIYQDAQGRKAKYLGEGKWQMQ